MAGTTTFEEAITTDWPDAEEELLEAIAKDWHPKVHFPLIRIVDLLRLLPTRFHMRSDNLYLFDSHLETTLMTLGDLQANS